MLNLHEFSVLLDYEYTDEEYSDNKGVNWIDSKFSFDRHENNEILFSSVFAYTLSRFVEGDEVVFNIVDDNLNHHPLFVSCENRDVDSFMDNVMEAIDSCEQNVIDETPDIVLNLNSKEINSYDFNANIFQKNDNYILKILYSDKYSKDTVNRFLESFKLILHDILNVNELKDINYTTLSDLKILDFYNQTQCALKYDDILDAFNDNLNAFADNNLVSYKNVSYTYAEGAFIADKIAKKLIKLGVSPNNSVSFLVERSELYMFCILGILSCGGVYVPLEDKHQDDRLRFMLKDTNTRVLIVNDETYERGEELADEGIVLLNISDIINDEIGNLSSLPIVYNDLACILYTSGTTGDPKGIKITKKAIVNLVEFYVNKYDIIDSDVFALFASIGFDVAIKCIFIPIYSGACLNIIPDDIKLDMDKLNRYLIDNNVTFTEISTQVAKLFTETVENTSLKVLFTGGEKLGESYGKFNFQFIDSYGPTEACVDVTYIDVDEKIDSSSIGYLLNNIKAYVLDDEQRRVPFGAVGELYLAGYQIADGYLNPEETEKAFIENIFDDDKNYNKLYRTGDMVRFLPDGSLSILGRCDSQVKIRGNRVELTEVESTIRNIDIVYDVTVQTIKNGENHELIAYVVTKGEIDDVADYVRNHVKNYKPDFMVPSFVVKCDNIPLTVNGKVNTHALPEVDLDSLRVEYVPATNELENSIMESFEEVFNQKTSLFDNFVRLGGDSIIAIRLISSLRKKGISCRYGDILNYKTPYLIAQYISKNLDSESYDSTEGEIDLLPIQSYFFDQININNYSKDYILKIKLDLDLDILYDSLDELTNVHDMLRAVYKFDEDANPIQEILPVNSRIYDLNEYSISDDFQNEMRNIFINSFNSLDIKNKLMDVNLIYYNDETYIMFVLHQLIVDEVSWNIFFADLTYIYFRLMQNKEIKLLKPYPYKLWVNDVKHLVENISADEKQHWIKINESINEDILKGNTILFGFNADAKYDADNILMLSKEETLALAIARAYKKTFSEDLILSIVSSGRDNNLANLDRTIGWFDSKYPVQVETNNGYDNVSLIKDVYSIKRAFKEVKNLGLNYLSLIYTSHDIEYKHTPVTFNFRDTEFIFKNKLFESINHCIAKENKINTNEFDSQSYGITFNAFHIDDSYIILGDFADNTYIADGFNEFSENIKTELDFIVNYSEDTVISCLSESQLGIYLDEKINDKGTAYSLPETFKCSTDYSINKIKNALHALIDKHPILKGRILDTDDMPILICDSYPSIEVVDGYSNLIKPFELDKSLARFFIIENEEYNSVFYDIHHIISDGMGSVIIDNELDLALKSRLDNDVDLGFVYASYNSFESQFEKSYSEAHDFYRNILCDLDDVGSLVDDVNGSDNCIRLSLRGISEYVEEFCHQNEITVSNFLNAVFAYTYSRFTGSSKVYYTFTEHGRHEDYSKDALGMFVRTIPIIVNCENASVNEYLSNVSNLILDSMMHSVYPFRFLANEFDITNNVSFEYNMDLDDISDISAELVIENFDLELVNDFLCYVNDLDDGYLISVVSCEKYSDDTVIRFLNVFKEILMQMLDKKELSDINYTSNSDLAKLNSFNDTEKSLIYSDILDAFNDNLAKYPKNVLVSFKDKSYSYAEGAFIANKIAKHLADIGVDSQDHVSFLVERSELYMFCVLGILSAGAVYVPLDDALPDERIELMLKDSDSKVILVSDETYERAENLIGENAVLLNISNIIKEDIDNLSHLPVCYGDLACILYTSGTTGVPKGVKVTRLSLLNVSSVYADKYGMNSDDNYGLYSAIGFDAASLAIVQSIYSGASLNIIPENIKLNMDEVNEYFIKHNITHTMITTPVAKLFMSNTDNNSLDVLLVGGEKLGQFNNDCDYCLVDGFGPTEAFSFISLINNEEKLHYSSVGKLNYNTKAYVLDDELRRVPIGAAGELYISGCQVADGYLNRPEENKKAFLNNPFESTGKYSKMYRSGDFVRFLSDGSLSIIGRSDGQVKIRGNRVELSEIEKIIREIDYVDDVTVQSIKNGNNNELAAYVVSDKTTDLKDSIQNYVAKYKPEYMIPSFVIQLDEIPLTVNGKVDKQSLSEVDLNNFAAEYVAPTTETEKAIVEAFEIVFDQNIGLDDDFLLLGGDSLTSIKITSILSKKGITVNANIILKSRTPREIASVVDSGISEYGFNLVKKGTSNQNMFFLPPISGTSFVYLPLINNLEFDGNVYIIDDYKYNLTVEEIKKADSQMTLDKYYYAVKELFKNGDIIVAHSQGCVFAMAIAGRLEQEMKIGKCILIDGPLTFKDNEEFSDERILNVIEWAGKFFDLEKSFPEPFDAFLKKIMAVWRMNSSWDLESATLYSPVLYLSTDPYNAKLHTIAPNAEFVYMDADHLELLGKAIPKVVKYLK